MRNNDFDFLIKKIDYNIEEFAFKKIMRQKSIKIFSRPFI